MTLALASLAVIIFWQFWLPRLGHHAPRASRFAIVPGSVTVSTAAAVIADCTTRENRSKGMALIGVAFGYQSSRFGRLLRATREDAAAFRLQVGQRFRRHDGKMDRRHTPNSDNARAS